MLDNNPAFSLARYQKWDFVQTPNLDEKMRLGIVLDLEIWFIYYPPLYFISLQSNICIHSTSVTWAYWFLFLNKWFPPGWKPGPLPWSSSRGCRRLQGRCSGTSAAAVPPSFPRSGCCSSCLHPGSRCQNTSSSEWNCASSRQTLRTKASKALLGSSRAHVPSLQQLFPLLQLQLSWVGSYSNVFSYSFRSGSSSSEQWWKESREIEDWSAAVSVACVWLSWTRTDKNEFLYSEKYINTENFNAFTRRLTWEKKSMWDKDELYRLDRQL